MHHVVFRSSIRQMCHVANYPKHLFRPFSSSTNNSTTSRENGSSKTNNQTAERISYKYGPAVNSSTSSIVESAIAKEGSNSVHSAVGVYKMSINGSSIISPKEDDATATKNITDSNFLGKSSYSNNVSSSDNDDVGSFGVEFRSVYVHPLSQIVLEYLQESHHAWVVSKGLDQSLTLHRDGSFELKHVPYHHTSTSTTTPTRSYSASIQKKEQRSHNSEPTISASASTTTASTVAQKNAEAPPTSSTKDTSAKENQQHKREQAIAPSSVDNSDNIRIWTSYDEQEKKHWLTVRQGLFRQRFLLQDNLLTAWQGNRGSSLQERLHLAVDEMIDAVDRLDRQQQQHQTLSMRQQQWHQKGQRRFRKR